MSLINEALKRAEEDKRLRTGASPPPADLPPIHRDDQPRRGPRILLILLGLMLVAGGVFAWVKMRGDRGGPARPAVAAAEPAPTRQPKAQPKPRKQEPAAHVSTEAELAFAKTIEAIDYYAPPAKVGPVEPQPSSGPTSQPATAQAASQPATQPAEQVAARPKPDHPVRPIMLTDRKDKTRPNTFTVSGIMHNGAGGCAIVNGQLVRPGDKLGDVKVIKINPYDVEMELDGRRFHVRI